MREAKAMAERLRAAAEEAVFAGDKGQEIGVTLSLGVASSDPARARRQAPPGAEELVRRADEAVYRAKRAGRNQVVCWRSRAPRLKPAAKERRSTKARRAGPAPASEAETRRSTAGVDRPARRAA
jgi:predicted signal transduction protein with EAL and GGDEF domain